MIDEAAAGPARERGRGLEHGDRVRQQAQDSYARLRRLEQAIKQPWDTWVEVEQVNDPSFEYSTTDDPGDYPSAAGSYGRRSERYVSAAHMSVVFRLTMRTMVGSIAALRDELDLRELFEDSLRHIADDEFKSATGEDRTPQWSVDMIGDLVTYSC